MTNPLRGLNHGLSEELNMLRETTRQFVLKELAPIADEVDRNNDFPHHLWQKMGALGLLGITVDELSFAREHGPDDLVARLEQAGVYPFTALSRRSVLRSP